MAGNTFLSSFCFKKCQIVHGFKLENVLMKYLKSIKSCNWFLKSNDICNSKFHFIFYSLLWGYGNIIYNVIKTSGTN